MTEINKDNAKIIFPEDARMKRRRILKTGAFIAPLAVTLQGGIPLAHASSAGHCVEYMEHNLMIPLYSEVADPDDLDHDGELVEYEANGATTLFDHSPAALTGRKYKGTGGEDIYETHWDYVLREELEGQTCLQSFMSSGGKKEDLDNSSSS